MRGRTVARALCLLGPVSALLAQSVEEPAAIVPVRPTAPLVRSYQAPTVPPIRLSDSGRLQGLIRAGVLYLSVEDAIVLALENNIDLEIARYGPILADWNLERAEAGGALPGVPSGAAQAGAVAAGQGVSGSQQSAGVTAGGPPPTGTSTNATISQIGPIAQTLDPIVQETTTFSHISSPQFNTTQSGNPLLILNTHAYTGSYQEGFLFGGNVTASYSDHYLKENAATDFLNPSVAPTLGVTFRQNLLQGLGAAVNGRQIEVSRINRAISDLSFQAQVSNTVATVLAQYYSLAADYADQRAKRQAVEVAQQLYQDAQRREQLGAASALDVTVAQSQLASAQSDLVIAETNFQQGQLQLKVLLGRRGALDPLLDNVQVLPLNRIEIPAEDEVAPVPDLIREAFANRPDLAINAANLKSQQVSAIGTSNGTLPTLQVFGSMTQAGLAGTQRGQAPQNFVGGIGTALGQVFRRDFPSQLVVPVFVAQIHDRMALADNAIDQLQIRQTELSNQKDSNQVQVEVQNYVIGLRQARVRYQAAVRNRVLQQQLFSSEQEKLSLGASTASDVIQIDRDFVNAQTAEISAEASYVQARIALDQAVGRTLTANHVSIQEAKTGVVARPSALPPTLPKEPPQ
jgi:outer membrane protein